MQTLVREFSRVLHILPEAHSHSVRKAEDKYFHFTNERTEAQKDLAPCRSSHSKGRGSKKKTKHLTPCSHVFP